MEKETLGNIFESIGYMIAVASILLLKWSLIALIFVLITDYILGDKIIEVCFK